MRPCNKCSTPVDNESLLCSDCIQLPEMENEHSPQPPEVEGQNEPQPDDRLLIFLSVFATLLTTTTGHVIIAAVFTGNQIPIFHSASIGVSIGVVIIAIKILTDWLTRRTR